VLPHNIYEQHLIGAIMQRVRLDCLSQNWRVDV
jgi:hypothetical protein